MAVPEMWKLHMHVVELSQVGSTVPLPTLKSCHLEIILFFFFGCTWSMRAFPGQRLIPCHSSNLSCCNQILNLLYHKGTLEIILLI